MVLEVDDGNGPEELDPLNIPILWRYRTRVTLGHVTRTLTDQATHLTEANQNLSSYPVLRYFLGKVGIIIH